MLDSSSSQCPLCSRVAGHVCCAQVVIVMGAERPHRSLKHFCAVKSQLSRFGLTQKRRHQQLATAWNASHCKRSELSSHCCSNSGSSRRSEPQPQNACVDHPTTFHRSKAVNVDVSSQQNRKGAQNSTHHVKWPSTFGTPNGLAWSAGQLGKT